MQEVVEKVSRKEKSRVILAIPPRHGKSQLSSIYLPAWAMGKYPNMKFILSTYGAELSEKMGLGTRDVISSDMYRNIFPEIKLRKDQKAKAKWMTNQGGSYTGVGIGTAVTGTGADCIILDDPHKDRAEAESETVRESVWEYYRSTLYSRLEGYGAVIVIMQRWHQDDLVGRLLEEQEKLKAAGEETDEWEVINFPAIAEDDEYVGEKKVRSKGEPLWPAKFPLPVLENIKRTAGVYNFVSQYQQDPILAEAQEFKEHMFQYYDEEDLKGKHLKYYTMVDPAISQKREADNSVILTVGKEVNGPNWYRIREDAGKFSPTQTINLIFSHHEEFNSVVGVETTAYQAALKFFVIEEQRNRGIYFTVREIKHRTKKEERVRGLLPLYNAGVIKHRRSDLEYERELLAFPRGRRDDRIDCMAMGLEVIENTRSGVARRVRSKFKSYVAMKRK